MLPAQKVEMLLYYILAHKVAPSVSSGRKTCIIRGKPEDSCHILNDFFWTSPSLCVVLLKEILKAVEERLLGGIVCLEVVALLEFQYQFLLFLGKGSLV